MISKQVSKNVFDVFVGEGWTNWSRFQIQGSQLKLVSGKPLDKDQYTELRKQLIKK